MPLIIDPDNLAQNREVYIDTAARTFRLVTDSATGGSPVVSPESRLDNDGVTLQAIYSFFKEEWKSDATLIPHPFPMIAVTPEQFEFIEDWEPANDTTRKLIRTGGWSEIDELDVLKRQYAGIITLGTFAETDDQAYYATGNDNEDTGAAINFTFLGPVNEAVLIYDENVVADTASPGHTFGAQTITRNDGGSWITDGYQVGAQVTVLGATNPENNGTYELADVTATVLTRVTASPEFTTGSDATVRFARDYRNRLKVFTREGFDGPFGSGKTFAQADLTDIGVTTLQNQVYRFPLASAADLKVTNSDATISARSPEVTITYYSSPQVFTGFVADASSTQSPQTNAAFGVVIDGMAYTAEEIYEFVQLQLRQAADINDGGSPITVITGNTADELLEFVGDSLQTLFVNNPLGGGGGVYITNFDANDTNRLSFADNEFGTTSRRTFPFVAAGTINFNPNLVNDSAGEFWMFYEYTERFTNTGFAIESAGAASSPVDPSIATLRSTVTDITSELALNDYIALSGFTDANNNGVWQVTSTPATVSPGFTCQITKINGDTVSNEAAGASISLDKNPINSPDAIIVDSNTAFSPLPIEGLISGASVNFDFDYDNNVQGGRTAGTDANILLRAIGLETAQFVETTGTITRATGLTFSLVAGLERNYSNP